jgi:HSP20 family protein
MRHNPWKQFLDDDMDFSIQPYHSMHPAVDGGIIPPVDIYEKGSSLIIETPLAGVDPDKVEVSVEGDMLTIKGSMERKTEIDEKNYYRKEVRSGSVFRKIPLPVPVIGDKAEATLEQGVLKIDIPKEVGEEKKSIKINVKKN